ncbi:LysR family transcriptional regulator [Catenuloplanes japonicus]|uniref:LysR family transcriptional regulator n=1 Tax=Catenuloplanes japonicus TaxID=33876 RepID=UPI00052572CA|nr:LysR family transcriptional regulator [Catenuloplanes japonicus]
MALRGVDLNLLPILDALLTERNVTRAAERMSVGQSAMSAALGRLRKQLGDPLLIRRGRVYELSALAESLVEPVRELVAAADALLGVRTPFDPATARRVFTVMTSDYVTLLLLKPLLHALAAEAPGIQLNVVAFTDDFEERLRRGGVDLLICPMQLAAALNDLPRTLLFEDRFVLAGDRDNPALREPVTPETFKRLRYAGNPRIITAELEAQGVTCVSELSVQSHVLVPFLLTGTPLVSFVQARLARLVSEQARLRVQPAPVPLQPLVEVLYWTAASTDDPAHTWLRACLARQAGTL